jgi:6,7-dimethyl-8-ribityllumazine synthase
MRSSRAYFQHDVLDETKRPAILRMAQRLARHGRYAGIMPLAFVAHGDLEQH